MSKNVNKVVMFENSSPLSLQGEINRFAKHHEIIDVSIATFMAGFTTYYTAIVLYVYEE